MAWPDALRRSRPILTSANSAPGGSSFTHTMDRRAIRPHNRHVPTLSFDDAFAEVKAKVDLVKVVQEYVRLTKRNKDFWGLCPFHQEDSPSFHVNPQRQSWYCFGCERKGDVFTFIELIEKTDKRGALQMLAERAGVELKKLSPEQRDRADLRKRILDLLKLSAQYYEYVLWKLPAGEPGRRVLESRHVGDEIARRGHAVLMEGQFDVITAHQFGLANAVASSGTALTDDQVRLLKRFTDELLLVFDADRAGRDAARKAAALAAHHGMRTRVATVPGAKDPDEFLRAGGHEALQLWQAVVDKAPSGFEAGVSELAAGLNPSNPNQVEAVGGRLREWIRQFPPSLHEAYAEVAERQTGISRHLLLRDPEPAPSAPAKTNGSGSRTPAPRMTPSRYLVQLLAVRPAAFERVSDRLTPEELDSGDRGVFVRMLGSYERGGPAGLEADLAGYPSDEQDLIRRAWAAPPPNVDDEVAVELAERIRLEHMKGMHSGIIRQLSEAERGKDSEKVAQLEAEAREIYRAIADMERRG